MQKVIALDEIEESVKRFLEKLTASAEGSKVEMSGRHVYLIVRPVEPVIDVIWTNEKNQRRAALIEKELSGTITPVQAVELEELTQQLRRYRDKVAPLSLDYARDLLEQLTAMNSVAQPNGDST